MITAALFSKSPNVAIAHDAKINAM
jgi:hypothetical protein